MAILVSFLSLAIAALALGWSIYRDVVMKGRLKVSFGWREMMNTDGSGRETLISLHGVNHGPGKVSAEMVMVRFRRGRGFPWTLRKGFVKLVERPHAYSDVLPKQLDVGDRCSMLFLPSIGFAKEALVRIGFSDNFGRMHWAPRGDVRAFIKCRDSKQDTQAAS